MYILPIITIVLLVAVVIMMFRRRRPSSDDGHPNHGASDSQKAEPSHHGTGGHSCCH